MLAKCANPPCNRQFRELSKGRLFVLPPFNECFIRLSDFCYWLCPECAAKCTITQFESEVVIVARAPDMTNSASAAVLRSDRRGPPGLRDRTQRTA